MKVLLPLSFALLLSCASGFAQDESGLAANRQLMEQSEQANRQAFAEFQQNTGPAVALTATPGFSVKAGTVAVGTQVRITSSTHYAVIYYTTNGWSPTTASRRYKGPITIQTTTRLQAIAMAPNTIHSQIASAQYTVKGAAGTPTQPLALSADGVLHAGTRLHLVTGSTVSSKTAHVGDHLNILLDQDVMLGKTVLVPKGAAVEATFTQADPAASRGAPGDVTFEVLSLAISGKEVPLKGGETLQGADHYGKVVGFFFVPVVGLAALAIHGDEAEIKPGMTFTAAVTADTALHP